MRQRLVCRSSVNPQNEWVFFLRIVILRIDEPTLDTKTLVVPSHALASTPVTM